MPVLSQRQLDRRFHYLAVGVVLPCFAWTALVVWRSCGESIDRSLDIVLHRTWTAADFQKNQLQLAKEYLAQKQRHPEDGDKFDDYFPSETLEATKGK